MNRFFIKKMIAAVFLVIILFTFSIVNVMFSYILLYIYPVIPKTLV